jgi:hypothetical protein
VTRGPVGRSAAGESLGGEGHGPEGHGPEGHGPEGHGPEGRVSVSHGPEDDDDASETEETPESPGGDDSELTGRDPSEESDPGDLDGDNDWPDDLHIRPGDETVDAEFEEINSDAPQPGFVRTGRPLDASKKP